ncbi:tetratricopeptide repeat protein [Aquimarina sp. MMG015]|uniref:tetratricopeptide repeat-containing sensor histidine kinase n=1 Tax=Aquimarina sp. MMG015 TaxID=2822689 RepID=UPI001B3A691D|nr:tetratricopeptide repeat protein [Aquimarina sp. MMG015]MBQ4805256.1 tetratricopeptide repeat protein [Aquimarina sp. MMG015]
MTKFSSNSVVVSMFFLFFIFLMGCDNMVIDDNDEVKLKTNLIEEYIAKANDNEISNKDRKLNANNAYNLAIGLEDSFYKRKKYGEISSIYRRLEIYNKSKNVTDEMLDLAVSINDSIGIARAYVNYGVFYRNTILDSAYINFNKADKIYTSLENSNSSNVAEQAFDHGLILLDLAKLTRKVKDYGESEDLTTQAIRKFELSGNLAYLPLSYNNLGIVAKHMDRYDDAVFYSEKAIESAKNTPKETLYAVICYNNIGTVYKSQKDYKKAIEYYKKALSYKSFLDKRPKRYARYLDNLTYAKFLLNKDNDSILELFNKSLKIRDSVDDIVGLSTNNLHLAEFYQHKGIDSLARIYALKVKEAAPLVNNNVELLQSYQLLTEVSDSEEGIKYARNHIKLSDSLVKEERSYNNKFARIQFESEKNKEEIAAISRENQYLIFAILGLSILSLLGYVIFKQQQSNKELLFEQNQQQSNQEIYRLLLSQQLKLEEGRKLEQHRMSEELHDGVLGRLFGVRLSLDGINQRANDGFTDARNKYIDELKSIEREIRLISHDLGTETLSPDIAYVDVVESLVSDLCTVHKMDFAFANDENIDWETVDDQKKVNLFRIIQESLQNIFKHARAKSVKINFDYVDDKINLTILDDGIGFKSSKVKRGIGLKNITSRVTQMDGVVDFISNQDSGTKVSVGIPI